MPAPIAAPAAATANTGPALPAATLSKGDVTATPGFNTTPAEVAAAEKAGFTPTATQPASLSPTVLSDSNIRDTVIPGLTTKASTLSPTPTTLAPPPTTDDQSQSPDSSSGSKYGVDPSDLDYGDIYEKVFGSENAQPQDADTTQALSTLRALGSGSDSAFATQIATLASQFQTNSQLLANSQSGATGKESNFLLAGNKGNAFRTSTGPAAMAALRNGQVNALADFQTKENNSIAKIRDAQGKSDYATMQKEMQVLDKVQSEKKALAGKISDELLASNKALATSRAKVTKDNAIADVFTSGITDPKSIMDAVNTDKSGNDTGLNVTLSDVNSALDDLSNGDTKGLTGSVGEYYSMKAAGTLPSSIKSLPDTDQLKAFIDLEKTSTSKTAATKPLYTTTKGQPVTKSDIEAGVEKLDASKDSSGYVDPKVYQAMYQYWEDQGLPPEDFVKNYPPKYYIDPTDTTLPSYLRPTAAKTSSASSLTLPSSLQNASSTPAS